MIKQYRPRIVIAEDHTLVAEACKGLLQPEFEVVAIFNNGQALIDSVCRLNPDIALVDISLPKLNGLDACEHIQCVKRTVKVVILTMNSDPAMASEAFRRGAYGFLPKTAAAAELRIAIRAVVRGDYYLSPLVARGASDLPENEGPRRPVGTLTTRQKQVVQLLAEGKSMKEVASDLMLTPRTVAFHKYRVMGILHLKNNAELVRFAMEESMVIPS